jgi:hypothetical protein
MRLAALLCEERVDFKQLLGGRALCRRLFPGRLISGRLISDRMFCGRLFSRSLSGNLSRSLTTKFAQSISKA